MQAHATEQNVSPILGAIRDPLLIFDAQADKILFANAAATQLLGYEPNHLQGMAVTELHPGQRTALALFADAVATQGHYRTQTLAPLHATGKQLRLEYSASSDPHDLAKCLVILVDLDDLERRRSDDPAEQCMRGGLTEWQRSSRIFRDMEQGSQLILRAAGEGIYGVNAEGTTIFVNPAAEKMLGWTATELVGKQMHTTVHHSHGDGSHYEHTECPIYAAFRDGVVHKVDDEVFWRKDGTSFFVEYTSTPVWDRGALVGAVIVFRDITERREAEDRLRKALDEVQSLQERLEEENDYLKEDIRQARRYHSIVGSSPSMETVLEQIELVASTDATVIITGESGTGKELIARAIHDASDRKDRPLIRVNCAAVPRELFESEFFGHAKGAFTGATRDRSGRFELADKGTLFLDEVGEIPIDLQGKLLRVLQERQFEPVGSNKTRNIDIRVIAATNRNLKEEVSHGRFREDLYFRLNVFPIQAVPLRDRLDDVPLLAQYFLKAAAQRLKMTPPPLKKHHVSQLCCYDWPGNVRELENVIERAVILSRGGELRFDLPETNVAVSTANASSQGHAKERILTEAERRARAKLEIETAVRASDGRIFGPDGAAAMLGLKPTTLLSRMKSLGISRSTRT